MDDMTSSPYPPFDGVEPYGTVRSVADERAHRKRMCALGKLLRGNFSWTLLTYWTISARLTSFRGPFKSCKPFNFRIRDYELKVER
jgi:hypothetical protein